MAATVGMSHTSNELEQDLVHFFEGLGGADDPADEAVETTTARQQFTQDCLVLFSRFQWDCRGARLETIRLGKKSSTGLTLWFMYFFLFFFFLESNG